jgi:NodT family efflux transporter outer membrane factor (OMF) lipoprotein
MARRRPLTAPLWCSALLVTACSLGPRYHKPDIAAADHWVTASDAAAPEWPAADWWRGFNSAELDAFIAQAESANDDLKAAIARVEEADAQRRVALAPLLPGLTAGATATRARQPVPGGAGYVAGNDFNPLLTASYALDFWGRNRAAYVAAAATERASRFDRSTVELTVLAGVATTYFQALELRDRLRVAERNLANAQEALRGLTLEQRAGIATALDVAQQQTVVDTVNASIPPLRQQLRQSQDALAILIGSTPEAVELTRGTLDELG